ncbi:MAG: hypothetical protein IPI97_09400 [Nitrosomonas sp.]|jgi:hypothetical protein|nr:hypothetical protein [Nitrosomonas sp.]MBK7365190.1 hypothetical protein [Nitrosomonas sp.]
MNDDNNDDHKSDESSHENMRYFLFWMIEQQELLHQRNVRKAQRFIALIRTLHFVKTQSSSSSTHTVSTQFIARKLNELSCH